MIPIPKGLFITPGRQSQPFRQARSSLGQYQMPARARVGQDEDKATEGLLMGASLAAKEYNQQASFERNELKKKAENTYPETLASQEATNLDNPHEWRKKARKSAQNVITDGTAKANPVLDFLFNDKRANEALTTHLDRFDAQSASREHAGVARKRVRQINVAKRTLLENMVLKTERGKRDIANGVQSREVFEAGGQFNYLRNESVKEVNGLITEINSFSHMSKDKKSELIDKLVEDWGTALVGAMTEFEPDALHQHVRDMQFLFSREFNNDAFTKYFDTDYQEKRFRSLSELIRARKEIYRDKAEGEARGIVNSLGDTYDEVYKKLQEGGYTQEWVTKIFEETKAKLLVAKEMTVRGTTQDPLTGVTEPKKLFTEEQIHKFGSRIYDALFFPVRQKLIRDLQRLSGDNNYENARKLLDSMQDPKNPAGAWHTWRRVISQSERESALTAFEREATKEQTLKASAGRDRNTRDMTALAKAMSNSAMEEVTRAFVEGVEKRGPGGEEYLTPLGTYTGKDTLRFEKMINRQVEGMRVRLIAAGESPNVIAVRIGEYKKKVADATPALAEAMARIHHLPPVDVVNSFSNSVMPWMTALGGVAKMNSFYETNRKRAESELRQASNTLTTQMVKILRNNAWGERTAANLTLSLKQVDDRYKAAIGSQFQGSHAMTSRQFMGSFIRTMDTIAKNKVLDASNMLKHQFLPKEGDMISRLSQLDAQIKSIDDLDQVAISPALRSLLYGPDGKASQLLTEMRSQLSETRKIIGALNAFQSHGVTLAESGITASQLSKHFNLHGVLPDQQKYTDFGPTSDNRWLGSDGTLASKITLWQAMIGSVGDGESNARGSAKFFLKLAPSLSTQPEFMPIFRSRINREALQSGEDGPKDILAFGEAAHTLQTYLQHIGAKKMDQSDASEFGRMAAAWRQANSSGKTGYEKAKHLLDYFDEMTKVTQLPKVGSIYARYSEVFGPEGNVKRDEAIARIGERFTSDLSSPFKEWFTYDNLEMSGELRSIILDHMRRGMWSLAEHKTDFDDQETFVEEWLYNSLVENAALGVDLLGTAQQRNFSLLWTSRMAQGEVVPHALSYHFNDKRGNPSKLKQRIIKVTDGSMSEQQAYSQVMYGVTLLTHLEESIKKGIDLRSAMKMFRWADTEMVFTNDIGGMRDILLRMADEEAWRVKGEKNIPENIDYSVGHENSLFGKYVGIVGYPTATHPKGGGTAFNWGDRQRLNLLAARRTGSDQSNYKVVTNKAQGHPVLGAGDRPTMTVILTNPPQWAVGGKAEWVDEAATAVGIPQSVMDIEFLSEAKQTVM